MALLPYFYTSLRNKYTYISLIATTFFLLFLSGCKTNKNTIVHRAFHDLTARFNGYYYATESIKEGEEKIRTAYKYDYDRLLPVFLVPDKEAAKATFPEFDKAIKKSSTCIQRHTIKDKKTGAEITSAGHWIDNNWNVIGISHFYKRDFFSGIEAFEYVISSYKSKDKYKSMIWLARTYNELGSPSQAEPILGILKEDKKISKYAKKQLPAVQADYYIKRGMYSEAEQALLRAMKTKPKRADRARYAFIIAQLYEEQNNNSRAREYYQKTIAAKPNYDLVFHARMKQSRLVDIKNGNPEKLIKELQKMTRDFKNFEYLDQIYYTIGEIHEKNKNQELAILNYKLSVKNSTQNPKQKALSYLKLGEINFDLTNYTASEAYYDSTMITLPKDYKNYDNIAKRKEILATLVGYIKTIQQEDSLQRIANMSEADREKFIAKVIQKEEEQEELKKEALEAAKAKNETPSANQPNNTLPDLNNTTKGDWYFYNPTTIAFGIGDFTKKFGQRKLEDNWRRSQKAISLEDTPVEKEEDVVEGSTKKGPKTKSQKSIESYLKNLPMSDSLIAKSNKRIIDAYYNLGSSYKEELNNNKKAIATFDELNSRFSDNKYKASTYYQLYRIYISTNNKTKAEEYKNKLLNEFPKSEYTQIIKNPNYVADKNTQKGEVEVFYTETYDLYAAQNFNASLSKSIESETKFGKNDYSSKFAFIKALSIGKLKGADSLEASLKQMKALYPKDPASAKAQELLDILYTLKHPVETGPSNAGMANQKDTFSLDLSSTHFVIAISPNDPAIVNTFKSSVADFNTKFYSSETIDISTSLFGETKQLTIIKTFKDAATAIAYVANLSKDATVFKGAVKQELFNIMVISSENMPRFYKKKKASYYEPFYNDHYKN